MTKNRELKQWAKHTPTPVPKRGQPRCSWRVNSLFISKDNGHITQLSPEHSYVKVIEERTNYQQSQNILGQLWIHGCAIQWS